MFPYMLPACTTGGSPAKCNIPASKLRPSYLQVMGASRLPGPVGDISFQYIAFCNRETPHQTCAAATSQLRTIISYQTPVLSLMNDLAANTAEALFFPFLLSTWTR
jgi:hypothetical protein